MKHNLAMLKAALATAPAATWQGRLTRRVEFFALTVYKPPNWLYTSGKPKRFNPRGIHCVYFAADADVARIEHCRSRQNLTSAVAVTPDTQLLTFNSIQWPLPISYVSANWGCFL